MAACEPFLRGGICVAGRPVGGAFTVTKDVGLKLCSAGFVGGDAGLVGGAGHFSLPKGPRRFLAQLAGQPSALGFCLGGSND